MEREFPLQVNASLPAKDLLEAVYHRLSVYFGPRHWWPGETQFEIMVGAILTQNTSWKNVEKAIENLKHAGLLDAEAMRAASLGSLAQLIRSSGYFNQKAIKLHALVEFLFAQNNCDIKALKKCELKVLRQSFLDVHGIGPETADSILLYALDYPVFVIDAYTLRSGTRLGLFKPDTTYHEAQEFFMANIPKSVQIYNEYHALLVGLGHHYCKPKPRCMQCPLADLCPSASLIK